MVGAKSMDRWSKKDIRCRQTSQQNKLSVRFGCVVFFMLMVFFVYQPCGALVQKPHKDDLWKSVRSGTGKRKGDLDKLKKVIALYGKELVHETDHLGKRPIWYAIGSVGNVEMVSYLIQQGFSINGETRASFGESPLMIAIRTHRTKIVDWLINNGADVNLAAGDTRKDCTALRSSCLCSIIVLSSMITRTFPFNCGSVDMS